MRSLAKPPTDFAVVSLAKNQDKQSPQLRRVIKPAPWKSIRESANPAGVSFQELISGQLLDVNQLKMFCKNASKTFAGKKTLFDKDRDFDGVERPLEGTLSLWQLCELVSDSNVRLGGQEPAVQAESKADSNKVKAELEAWEADFAADLQGLNQENLGSLRWESSRSTQNASQEKQWHQLDKPYISVNGCWQTGMDDGPGSADNPQVQLQASRHTLLQVELRAIAPQAGDALELWVLSGTRWGSRVKSLLKSDPNADDADFNPSSPEWKAFQETKNKLLYGHIVAQNVEESSRWSFKVLASASSVAESPGPLRVRIECELSAQDTVTLVLARGQAQPQPEPVKLRADEDERSSSKGSRHASVASVLGRASEQIPPASSLPKRPVPSQTTTPRRARVWGWQPKASQQPDAASSNDSFDVRLWTSSPCSKGPTLLSCLPEVVPKVEKEGPTTAELLAEKAVRHEDLLARAEASLWAARANFALHARFCMNADIDEMRGNIAAPKRQVSGGSQKSKLGLGAPKTAR